jgi:HTH-type transcriptional regulator / antitoxin HigA
MTFNPDYAEPPGSTLEEALEERSMSQAELARRTSLSAKHINQIVNGKAPLTPETAARLEEVLGIRASLWNRLESNYREGLLRLELASPSPGQVAWLDSLPVKELQKRGHLPLSKSKPELIVAARRFFRVASEAAWDVVAPRPEVLLRQSSAHQVDRPALAAWIEIVRRRASTIETAPYSEQKFRECLVRVRAETISTRAEIGSWLEGECAVAGVRIVFEPEITGARVSGAAFWLTHEKPVIGLSLRGKQDDQVWFSFFHEAGHLLLHSGNKDNQWIDDQDVGTSTTAKPELEADVFARDLLIEPKHAQQLLGLDSIVAIRTFAIETGLAPGVVVGRIQREASSQNKRAFAFGNELKRPIKFGDYDAVRGRWSVTRGALQ